MDKVCYTCHPDSEVKFIKTNTHKPVMDGLCSSCHDGHGSDKKGLLLAKTDDPKLCSGCHEELMRETPEGSVHPLFKSGKCLDCHDAHGSNISGMLAGKQGQLCFSCHEKGMKNETAAIKSEHPTFTAGECTKCHNPHKTKLDNLLLTGTPDLCLSCHIKLRNDMRRKEDCEKLRTSADTEANAAAIKECDEVTVYLHAPSALENCLRCHKSHVSAEPGLMIRPVQQLCAECHDYRTDAFGKAHIYIEAGAMDCNKCHDPHTSKGPMFFRDTMHKPFNPGECGECHMTGKQ